MSCLVFASGLCSSSLFVHKGRGLTFTSAHVLVRPLISGPSSPPTDRMDHTRPRSHARFGRLTTACVAPLRNWAVSIASVNRGDFGPFHDGPTWDTCHMEAGFVEFL